MSVSSASKGTLFLSFQRSIGTASSAERGNSSKCCTKTRMTVSGRIMATSSSRARNRPQAAATAALTAGVLAVLILTAGGTRGPGGHGLTAYASSGTVGVPRGAGTGFGETSGSQQEL